MDKNNPNAGQKVSQIANLFQRKNYEDEKESPTHESNPGVPASNVVRTESHAARFNNARALFEKLGEGRINQNATFSIKLPHSNSKEDNLKDLQSPPDKNRSPSPKKKQHTSNGGSKLETSKILNVSRFKSEKPEKPEKPERKFNSKELIEKQKNWTSHFSKSRSATGAKYDINRCDIIRAVPVANNEVTVRAAQVIYFNFHFGI